MQDRSSGRLVPDSRPPLGHHDQDQHLRQARATRMQLGQALTTGRQSTSEHRVKVAKSLQQIFEKASRQEQRHAQTAAPATNKFLTMHSSCLCPPLRLPPPSWMDASRPCSSSSSSATISTNLFSCCSISPARSIATRIRIKGQQPCCLVSGPSRPHAHMYPLTQPTCHHSL